MRKRVVILGAGPAGLALALQILRRTDLNCEVTVIEQNAFVGGIASSFQHEGLFFDMGSHRLHPSTPPEIMKDIRSFLGADLLERPRNGRIRLFGRFVRFPLNPLDLSLHLPPSFIMGIGLDTVMKTFRRKEGAMDSFKETLMDGLGPTVCKAFYFPYARKIWGMEPEDLSVLQAKRRVSAGTLSKMLRKVLSVVPGLKPKGAGRFYYPRRGFGQISEALKEEVLRLGGKVILSSKVREVQLHGGAPSVIASEREGAPLQVLADLVFSTIPMTLLLESLRPGPPAEVIKAAQQIRYRAMVFCYLILETDQFTRYDAHYFPEGDVIFSRLSEPKNYSEAREPKGTTGLCIEIPCSVGNSVWSSSEEEISRMVINDMAKGGLPVNVPVKASFVRRIPRAYPVYNLEFESAFNVMDDFMKGTPGLVSLGRQGLLAHDNIHHTMEMAYRAADCLKPGLVWDSERWLKYRAQFEKNVVED